MFATDLASVAGVIYGESSNAVRSVLAPERGRSLDEWASIVDWFWLNNLFLETSIFSFHAVVLTANLTSVAGVIYGESSDAGRAILAPERH